MFGQWDNSLGKVFTVTPEVLSFIPGIHVVKENQLLWLPHSYHGTHATFVHAVRHAENKCEKIEMALSGSKNKTETIFCLWKTILDIKTK